MGIGKVSSLAVASLSKVSRLAKLSIGKINGFTASFADSFADSYSLSFDGVDDYVTTGTGGGSNTQDFTISWWMRASETGANGQVFSFGDSGGFPIMGFGLNQAGGAKPLLTYGSSRNVRWVDNSAQDDDAWHHWLLFMDASDPNGSSLYIDGSVITVEAVNDFYTTATFENLEIGRDAWAYAEMYMGDFAVFTGDKTGNVSDHYNSGTPTDLSGEDDLHLYYKFEENTGTTVADSSSNSNDGTLVNTPTWSSSTP
jgi:hypothetical protein